MAITDFFKRLFGKTKARTEEFLDKAEDIAERKWEQLEDKGEALAEKTKDWAEDKAESLKHKASETVDRIKSSETYQKGEDALDQTVDAARDLGHGLVENFQEFGHKVADAVSDLRSDKEPEEPAKGLASSETAPVSDTEKNAENGGEAATSTDTSGNQSGESGPPAA